MKLIVFLISFLISSSALAQSGLFYTFELKVHQGLINWTPNDGDTDTADGDGHAFKLALSNTAPNFAWDDYGDITETANGYGYTTGGQAIDIETCSQSSGVLTITIGTDITWTASGGTMGAARYMYIYDDTSSGNWLVGVWDYGSSFSLVAGQSIVVHLNGLTLLTVQ